jgi:membrane associated rhomboid family serine protease
MNPGGETNLLGNAPVTKLSIGICIAIASVTVLGWLPRFAPYFILSISAFRLPFPKVWVLITSTFYCSSFLSAVIAGVFVIMLGKVIEPIIGSKEFLRLFLMIGFFTNCLMLVFGFLAYVITSNSLILVRPFESHSAGSAAILMALAHALLPVEMPTSCCVLKVRLFPFHSLWISAVFALFSPPDDLIATVIGTVLSYVYIRYIKKNGDRRGDPTFVIEKLAPSCGGAEEPSDPANPDEDREMNQRMAAIAGVPPEAIEGERRNFRLDQGGGGGNPRQQTGQNLFQGRPRTIGP